MLVISGPKVVGNILRLLALASLATAIAIPDTTTEESGLSTAHYGPASLDGLTLDNTGGNGTGVLDAREPWIPNVKIYCGCGYGTDADQTNVVVRDISAGSISLGDNQARMQTYGNTVAFVCNFGRSRTISGSYFRYSVVNQMSPVCGSFVAGTWENKDCGSCNIVTGYMRYNGESVAQICNNARGSNTQRTLGGSPGTPYIC